MSSDSNQAIDSSSAHLRVASGVVVGLVEDDPDQAAMISSLLTDTGCRAVVQQRARVPAPARGRVGRCAAMIDAAGQSGLRALSRGCATRRQALPVIMLTVRRARPISSQRCKPTPTTAWSSRRARRTHRACRRCCGAGIATGDTAAVACALRARPGSPRGAPETSRIVLTERRFDLALFMFRRPGRVVSRDALRSVWNVDGGTRALSTSRQPHPPQAGPRRRPRLAAHRGVPAQYQLEHT